MPLETGVASVEYGAESRWHHMLVRASLNYWSAQETVLLLSRRECSARRRKRILCTLCREKAIVVYEVDNLSQLITTWLLCLPWHRHASNPP